MLERYYNRFDPARRYTELLFRAGDGLQSAELNELQSTLKHRLRGVADALLKDGNVVSGCAIVVDADSGHARCGAGRIYIAGAVHEIEAAEFDIPTVGRVTIGVRRRARAVTELDDPTLRDPAVGTRNYMEPGAGRLEETVAWGWVAEAASDGGGGEFYPVAAVIDGVLQRHDRPPAYDGVTQVVARYDYEANGHYIAHGLGVRFLERRAVDGKLALLISSGTANVLGHKVERAADERLLLEWDPDIAQTLAEPTVFAPDANGEMRIVVNNAPIERVLRVQGTRRKNVTVTHGVFSGATDTLPDAAVVQVLAVQQGETAYQAGTDYVVTGNAIAWSPAGAEPAPGSSYTVTYDCIVQTTPTALDEEGFAVSGFVPGTLVQVDYDWRVPRVDALCVGRDGLIQRIRGVAAPRGAVPPAVPPDLLRLCDIRLSWRGAAPLTVVDSGVRAVPTAQIEAMRADIARLYDLIARDRLSQDITLREPAAKKGVFVDAFRDDDLRDAGEPQDAVCVMGQLMPPIAATTLGPWLQAPQTLAHGYTPVVEQLARTGSMRVNPYQAIELAPAAVTLSPARDLWTDFQTQPLAAVTEIVVQGEGDASSTWTARSTEVVSRVERSIPTLRPIAVAVRALGFGPNEAVAAMRFDGIDLSVPAGLKASAAGVVETSFQIPPGVPAGVKRFEIEGAGGSYGEALFEGRGRLVVTQTRERITQVTQRWWVQRWWTDPLAQTFTLPESRQIAAVDLWFTTRGARAVTVQLRETLAGFPARSTLAEARLEAAQLSLSGPTRFAFDAPTMLQGGVEYALVVLTDDADAALAIAELGKWDASAQRWVTAQPYQVGVLLSSANASTWTAHQDKDLTFRLLAAAPTQRTRTVDLARDVPVTGATDLMLLGDVDLPQTGCAAQARITLEDGRVLSAAPGSTISLDAAYSGRVSVALDVSGTSEATPIVWPGWQLVVGSLAQTASYVSRAIQAAASFDVRVIAEVFAPGSASVGVGVESGAAGQWAGLGLHAAEPVGDGWVEIEWRGASLSGVGADKTTRIKLTIDHSAQHRARVRSLRAVVV